METEDLIVYGAALVWIIGVVWIVVKWRVWTLIAGFAIMVWDVLCKPISDFQKITISPWHELSKKEKVVRVLRIIIQVPVSLAVFIYEFLKTIALFVFTMLCFLLLVALLTIGVTFLYWLANGVFLHNWWLE